MTDAKQGGLSSWLSWSSIKKSANEFGIPRLIIIVFLLLLIILSYANDMNLMRIFGDVLRRWGMFGILILAMVPGIQSGIGPNFGVTVGITGGLLGAVLSLEMRFRGWFNAFVVEPVQITVVSEVPMIPFDSQVYAAASRFFAPVITTVYGVNLQGEAFVTQHPTVPMFYTAGLVTIAVAILLGIVIGAVMGYLYGVILNRVKGSEMAISVYIGFSVVALFNIIWFTMPVSSGIMILPATGSGLRQNINLRDDFGNVLNRIFQFDIGTERIGLMNVPTGLLVTFFFFCFIVWLFSKSRLGLMMSAAGSNPEYARASGINVDKMRILGTVLSTVLGAVGIIVYAQSFGFLQLYSAPMQMGFATVAAVLIGGATVKRARVADAIIGALLFHSVLTIALPLSNRMLADVPALPEILRVIITNGIILYALSRTKGGRG